MRGWLVVMLTAMVLPLAAQEGPEQVMRQLEAQVGRNPYDPVSLNNLAVNQAQAGEVFQALDLLERALRFAPEQPVIIENHRRLREWVRHRLSAPQPHGAQAILPLEAMPEAGLPEPPPLWPGPASTARGP